MKVTFTSKASTGVIPLTLPSEADSGRLLLDITQRVIKACGKPQLAEDHIPPWKRRKGFCWTLLRLSGGNCRCLAFLLAHALNRDRSAWTPGGPPFADLVDL